MDPLEALGDLVEHHLGGTTADRVDANVAIEAFHRGLSDVSHAPVELDAFVEHVVDELAD